ncbi:hypothetical protein C8R46DRAFT_1053178 [Mycena filopes]|nr:hypothetical protein C8R46DRAFT_1053178 [Mycena filopes]
MAGSGSFECVDTQNSLESCGGCVGAPSSTGQDCSAIPDVDAVSCSKGRCLVTACHGNMTVSALGDSCVDSQTASVMRGSGFFGAFKRTK